MITEHSTPATPIRILLADDQPLLRMGFRLILEGRHEMIDLIIRPEPSQAARPGDLVSVRLRSLGETGAGEFIIDRRGDEAQVGSQGRLQSKQPNGHVIDLNLKLIDSSLVLEDLLCKLFVLLDDALDAPVNGSLDEGAHLEKLRFQ